MTDAIQGIGGIELGRQYEDKITKFRGIATAVTMKMGGQILVTLEGPSGEQRNRAEGDFFDSFRLEPIGTEKVDLTYPTSTASERAGSLASSH